eukprot:scaffold232067_cov47-Prasinocladus_malaysianus.AAC.1
MFVRLEQLGYIVWVAYFPEAGAKIWAKASDKYFAAPAPGKLPASARTGAARARWARRGKTAVLKVTGLAGRMETPLTEGAIAVYGMGKWSY